MRLKKFLFTLPPGVLPKHTSRLLQREQSTTPVLEHSSRQSQKTSGTRTRRMCPTETNPNIARKSQDMFYDPSVPPVFDEDALLF
ncbi:hypothetical protein IID10_17985 [candidate division KSB1 bacterium]|nr:hypothetical protein [candidate division KSB1 bacterium]